MSGSVGGFAASGVMAKLIADAGNARGAVDRLTGQASSGKVADSYGGLGSTARVSLDLRPALAHGQAWQDNIGAAGVRLDATQTALSQIGTLVSSVVGDTLGTGIQTTDGVAAMARRAADALAQVKSLLNTRVGDVAIFAGTDSARDPVPAAAFDTYVGQVQAPVAGLSTSGAAATAAATLGAASSGSPFSATLGTRPDVEVAAGRSAPLGLVAGQNGYAVQTGSNTTGSWARDVVRGLASLAALSGSDLALGSGFTDFVATARDTLQGAGSAIATDAGGLGGVQQDLAARAATLTDTATALTAQVAGVEEVDMAATSAALAQVQTQLQASYKLIAGMKDLSLVNFI